MQIMTGALSNLHSELWSSLHPGSNISIQLRKEAEDDSASHLAAFNCRPTGLINDSRKYERGGACRAINGAIIEVPLSKKRF